MPVIEKLGKMMAAAGVGAGGVGGEVSCVDFGLGSGVGLVGAVGVDVRNTLF